MKILNCIFFGLFLTFPICGCSKKEETKNIYNQKANEIVLQVINENNCNCLLEIQNKSLIESSEAENPSYDIRSFLIKELNLENNQELNNLVNLSKDFTLNIGMFKESEIRILELKDIPKFGDRNENVKVQKFLKTCPNGIITLKKPVFDKTYQKAILDYDFTFTCSKTYPLPIYEYRNGKWNRIGK